MRAVRRLGGWAVGLAAVLLTAYRPTRLSAQDTTKGKAVYVKWCAGCHGDTGDGKGPSASYMLPRPRDFTGAIYKIRTTASGLLPTDADLMRAIDEGLPGSAMPAWKDRLSDGDRRDVMAYLKTFSAFFADTTQHPAVLKFASEPGGGTGAEALKVGRQFYDSILCRKCHGDQGRGDGPSAPTLKDDAGAPIFAADLHHAWRFRGGATAEDVYHRMRTGLDGTPMPSFSDLLDQKFLTEEQLWRVAQYVRSLSPEKPPEVRDVIHARQVTGALPVSPDDSAWGHADRYYFPLVGQVIRKARWFAPAVEDIWVQAVHDGKSIAFRVTWDDRSQSPDTAWNVFTRRLLATVVSDDSTPPTLAPWPDQLAVQFPVKRSEGMERPYFLMGSSADPVYQWRWTSMPRRASAGLARGVERFDTLPSAQAPGSQAVFDHGQWRVVFTRTLATADSANELQFAVGRAIPVAFFAWDGSSAERGTRMAVSTWYFLALDQPTPPGTFISPVIAMLLTLGLGLFVVGRPSGGSEGRGDEGDLERNSRGGTMRRLSAVAAVGAGLLVLALRPAPAPRSALAGSTVSGKIKFVGKAPANPTIDMSEEPKCKAKYTTTPPHNEVVVANKNGTLANVFVYVKTGLPAGGKYPAPTTAVVIDQAGCLYHPRVFGIMVGQNLEIKNSDPLLHNIKAMAKKNRPFNISQPTAGMTTIRTFNTPEVPLPVECNVHGWMHAYVGVLPHPFFAATGTDGSFSIKGLPAGTYTIEAWHEKYGAQTATVTVTGSDTKTADFTYTAK